MTKAKHNPPMRAKKGKHWPWHRPKAIDEDTLRKLSDAFANAMTDIEACLYADIAPSTLYLYAKENPGFSEWKEELKKKPGLKAKLNIVKRIEMEDENASRWWLERKNSEEFASRQKMEHSGEVATLTKLSDEQVALLESALGSIEDLSK